MTVPSKILWVCKQTGQIAETNINEVPISPTLEDNYRHDWVPVQVIHQ